MRPAPGDLRVLAAFVLILAGCGGDGRQALTGVVTYDGEPIHGGSIALVPDDASVPLPRTGALIEEGKFAIPRHKGPLPGRYRVDIRWPKKTGKKVLFDGAGETTDEMRNILPDKYNTKTTLLTDIGLDTTTLDFRLTSR